MNHLLNIIKPLYLAMMMCQLSGRRHMTKFD